MSVCVCMCVCVCACESERKRSWGKGEIEGGELAYVGTRLGLLVCIHI